MKTAIIHDWLITQGGAEKVLQSIYQLFPSPIYTLFFDKMQDFSLPKHKITSSFLDHLPFSSCYHRFLLPLFPFAVKRFDLSGYDVLISSSHAVAKGIRKRQGQLHICYCHTPMRYAWDLKEEYLGKLSPFMRYTSIKLLDAIGRWDVSSSLGVDVFIANSLHVAKRIERCYNRKSTVIYPPVATDRFYLSSIKEKYFVTHARLVPYKKIDLMIEAFGQMQDKRLVIIGQGPEEKKLQKMASKNVDFLGKVSDEELARVLSKARGYLFAAEEDFGIGLVEAQSCGLPVIAFQKGGALETVVEGKTGLFFQKQTVSSLIEAIGRFEKMQDLFDPVLIRAHAERFSTKRFKEEFSSFVSACLAKI
jgi:glycosyltransferase involved in cell wall biosynthesis